ncbi:alpha/beta fold hydrolase [Amnibacterium kyonggiense]|uniref:Alpha-beta hydrolase superfamily lysophospholipase n=1 Tax=Amnibacterium kyonggiense TaxID=595671 RepID=A0A4R7FQM4_9MICO|nr:alpha/beta fold hydrolase [Amnibacterium kyonggiense]TDS80006.1 alpha-beta hydrolase superfamily lysophospholipase [Amnibacterium kyonggiense]
MPATTDVVFIHGLWIHAAAWQPWMDLFASRGYTPIAPGWPGDGDTVAATRADPAAMNGIGIADICRHYIDLIARLGIRPVVVGHSFGGLIAQELLALDLVSAAVAIDPAPIRGVTALPFAQLRSGFPVLGHPALRKKTVALTAKQFRYGFGNTLPAEESDALFDSWSIPGPGRPLFEDAAANFSRHSAAAVDTHSAVRGPLLLTSGTEDHTVPKVVTLQVAKLYADNSASTTEYHEFEGRGHSLTIDHGWEHVADDVLGWLAQHGLAPDSVRAGDRGAD